MTSHFWVWRKSHCSSSIATELPCFSQLLLEALTHFSYKEVNDLQKIKLFMHLFYPIFFKRNTVTYCNLVPNTLEIQIKTRLTFSQSQHSKRLLNVIAHTHTPPTHMHTCMHACMQTHAHTHTHTHTIKYNSFDL